MNKNQKIFFEKIDLKNGKIIYNDLNINPKKKFEDQKWSFKEDILQIEFFSNYLIDVGYYPEFDPKGFFVIEAIKNYNWENPIFFKKCKEYDDLKKYLQEAIDFINDIRKK